LEHISPKFYNSVFSIPYIPDFKEKGERGSGGDALERQSRKKSGYLPTRSPAIS
jgi:hypothetical protein